MKKVLTLAMLACATVLFAAFGDQTVPRKVVIDQSKTVTLAENGKAKAVKISTLLPPRTARWW